MFDMVRVVEAPVASLSVAAAHARPVSAADTRLLAVPAALAPILPEGGLRRGSTVSVGPLLGGASLALAMVAELTGRGRWAAVVGWPSIGLAAAAELGADLRRLALVPDPGTQWPVVVAALVDGFELLVVRPRGRVRAPDARRLMARVRERAGVLVVLDFPGWPESPDIRLAVGRQVWDGLGDGHGLLRSRRMEVVASGRRLGGVERHRELLLPAGADGASVAVPAGKGTGGGEGGRSRPGVPMRAAVEAAG